MQGISDANLAWAEWESRHSAKSASQLTGLRGEAKAETDAEARHRRVSRLAWLAAAAAMVLAGVGVWYFVRGPDVPERPPIARIVISAPTSARDDEIGELLRTAAAHVDALRLTTPAGDNAFQRYQEVLALEPDNEDAARGLEVIVSRYVTLANTALSNGELDKAEGYLDSAAGVRCRRGCSATTGGGIALLGSPERIRSASGGGRQCGNQRIRAQFFAQPLVVGHDLLLLPVRLRPRAGESGRRSVER
jgi:hypothetical protein